MTAANLSRSHVGKCFLKVAGKTYLSGPYNIAIKDDGFTIGVGDERRSEYVAYISGDGESFWNGPEAGGHAHTPLGRLVRDGDCWVNERARVCVDDH